MQHSLLLIAWYRPHTLRRVINAIRPIEPTRLGVSRAINWFFEQVEEVIIYVRPSTSYRRGFRIIVDLTTICPKYHVVIPKRVHVQFGLDPGQQLQVLALPGRNRLVPSQPPAALRGFLQGKNTFQREPDRL